VKGKSDPGWELVWELDNTWVATLLFGAYWALYELRPVSCQLPPKLEPLVRRAAARTSFAGRNSMNVDRGFRNGQ